MNKDWKHKGFSLVELMIVVSIVAILAGIVYPSYLSQIQKTRRTDAKIGLTQLAQQLERCFTEFNVYNSANCAIVGAGQSINITSPDGRYTIKSQDAGNVENLTASGFKLYATPIGPQANDTCGTFTLDNFGNKTTIDSIGTESSTAPGCWE